jgi:hypothetical protein
VKTTRVALAALLLGAVAGCGMPPLQKFSTAEGRFEVQMPGTPQEKTETIPTGKLHCFTCDFPSGAYAAQWIDLPQTKGETEAQLRTRLEKARDNAIANLKGKLLTEKDKDGSLKLAEKYPGLEFSTEIPSQNGMIHARLYLVEGRLYQLMVLGRKSFVESKEADTFLQSFALLP